MYDRRLDALVAAAELGSFAKAAKQLHISTAALVKQVNAFEAEHGITVFERSRQGVKLAPTGAPFIEDARALIRQADEMLRRARERERSGEAAVRLGVSVMCPGQKILDLWPRVHELDPSLKLELSPIGSIYDDRESIVRHLGERVDLVLTSYSPQRWDGLCRALSMGSVPLAIDVPLHSPLAKLPAIELSDLAGVRVYELAHANDATTELCRELRTHGTTTVTTVDDYTLELFNECADTGGALITSGAWSGLHPMLITVPLAQERLAPCVLLYPLHPAPAVQRFVVALEKVCSEPPFA